jgi:hypothetical protein
MTPLDIERVRRRLPGRQLAWFETLGSTMHEAARMAAAGCSAGTAVVAEEQTAGQGRHGHSWHSEPGAGLYVSVVLRLSLPPDSLPALTLALGLATAEAIARVCDLSADLRWPNDVMIDDRKVAGILVQLSDSVAGVAIAGIGVNVNHARFPPELASQATSLGRAAGSVQSRAGYVHPPFQLRAGPPRARRSARRRSRRRHRRSQPLRLPDSARRRRLGIPYTRWRSSSGLTRLKNVACARRRKQ